jgi:hypothetical protein
MRSSLLVFVLASSSACAGGFSGEITPPEGTRVVSGKLDPVDPEVLSRSQVALQLVAVAIDAREEAPIREVVVGVPFNPAGDGASPSTFRIAIPTDRSVALFFQVPIDSGRGIGQLAARVRFAKNGSGDLTDVLSGRTRNAPTLLDLDLGRVKITAPSASQPGEGGARIGDNVAILGEGESANPLSINDIDGDGTPDLEDSDDDDDLIPDDGDQDANGDDIPDLEQSLEALTDSDDDSVPDVLEAQP